MFGGLQLFKIIARVILRLFEIIEELILRLFEIIGGIWGDVDGRKWRRCEGGIYGISASITNAIDLRDAR